MRSFSGIESFYIMKRNYPVLYEYLCPGAAVLNLEKIGGVGREIEVTLNVIRSPVKQYTSIDYASLGHPWPFPGTGASCTLRGQRHRRRGSGSRKTRYFAGFTAGARGRPSPPNPY